MQVFFFFLPDFLFARLSLRHLATSNTEINNTSPHRFSSPRLGLNYSTITLFPLTGSSLIRSVVLISKQGNVRARSKTQSVAFKRCKLNLNSGSIDH